MAEFTVNNLLTRNQIESSTSATEGKVYFATDGGIYIGQPDHTTVLAETSHDNLATKTQLASYLNLSGGEMTGPITNNVGGQIRMGRARAALMINNPDETDNIWYPVLDVKTTYGDWSIGHITKNAYMPMDGLMFTYVSDKTYAECTNSYINYSYLMPRVATRKGGSGDQILTSYDISNRQNLDGRYIQGNSVVCDVWTGTQAQYDALATKSNTTLYLITA